MNSKDLQQTIEFLEETPKIINREIKDLPVEILKEKPTENEFSIHEHIWHLHDIERLVSNVKRFAAHRFYLKRRMIIEAHYFSMQL